MFLLLSWVGRWPGVLGDSHGISTGPHACPSNSLIIPDPFIDYFMIGTSSTSFAFITSFFHNLIAPSFVLIFLGLGLWSLECVSFGSILWICSKLSLFWKLNLVWAYIICLISYYLNIHSWVICVFLSVDRSNTRTKNHTRFSISSREPNGTLVFFFFFFSN